ncbi:DUF1223 domain-containing protein [Parasediminibacterium sp. JCM 36343]|uniref:DUF1223 domain-containing protein n=1 Tax=Parasediminibacterium sp. JCM 36343 TaxID=3374279 RepID=UPI00397D9D0B
MKLLLLPLLLLSAALASCQTSTTQKGTAINNPIVIELFTSQGCSSCPSAEKLLTELSDKDTNILLLSFHVDYWNRLGWVDSFSQKAFSERQRKYADIFRSESVYTPQAVVNGQFEAIGSNRHDINRLINQVYTHKTIIIGSSASRSNGKIMVAVQGDSYKQGYRLLALLVEKNAFTKIKAGENEGLLLQHKNIVREVKEIRAGQKGIYFAAPQNYQNYQIVVLAQEESRLSIDDVSVLGL